MAKVIYAEGIKTVRGAIDSVKDGQAMRMRLVSRLRWHGARSIDEDGNIIHELYFMHMHEGPWSEGATRNREMFKAAHRIAHDIEHVLYHPEKYDDEAVAEANQWHDRYNAYLATIPKGSSQHYKFYGWMYTQIYRAIREESQSATVPSAV